MSCGERLVAELRSRKRRVTPQRAVIMETIAHMQGHLSPSEVHQVARERLPGLNLATVYRTLDTLHQDGLLDTFQLEPGQVRYALRELDHLHGHLVCSECGAVLDFDPAEVETLRSEIEARHGFRMALEHLTLRGRCETCAAQGQPR